MPAEFGHLPECGDRVLVVADVAGFDFAEDPDRSRQRPLHVAVQPDHVLRPECGTQSLDGLDFQARVTQYQLAFEHGGTVFLAHADAIVGDLLRTHFSALAKGEVFREGDVLAHSTAKQAIERFARHFAAQVPQGDFDGTECLDHGTVVRVLHDLPGRHAKALASGNVQRIFSDQPFTHFPDGRKHIDRRRFSKADQALIGFDLDHGL